jgi:hypothetical protein
VLGSRQENLRARHHREISPKHLQSYLDEYVFRYNNRGDERGLFMAFLDRIRRSLLLIRVLLRGFIQRVEELVALGYGYLQSLVRRLARFAFPDEPPSAPVDHGIPILTVVSHPPESAPALPATSYQPDFSGVWAKIERAKEHLDALRRETGLGIGAPIPDAYRIPMRLEYEPSSGDHVFRATATIPEDAVRRVGILVGDIAHNLRSALDHLVWQLSLVRTKGREPNKPKIIQFPIQDSPPPKLTDKRRFLENGALYKLRPEHRAIIYEHQPHQGHFDERHVFLHPLARLRELSNHDKHQVITPVTVLSNRHTDLTEFFQGYGGEITDMVPLQSGAYHSLMNQDTEVVRVKVRPASLQLNMEMAGYVVPNPSVIDRFPEGPARIVPLDGILEEIMLEVLDVVRDFHQLSY